MKEESGSETPLRYGGYLQVEDLLRLQRPLSRPPHHDETLFIIAHQAIELWLKLLLHGLDGLVESLRRDDPRPAQRLALRGGEILRLLQAQLRVLETMSCLDFLEFRDELEGASGFQSAQFRELEALLGVRSRIPVVLDLESGNAYLGPLSANERARFERRLAEPDLEEELLRSVDRCVDSEATPRLFLVDLLDAARESEATVGLVPRLGSSGPPELSEGQVVELAGRAGVDQAALATLLVLAGRRSRLRTVYSRARHRGNAGDLYDLWQLCEALIDLSEALALFRSMHVKMVERMIGRKRGTGGSPGVSYLEKTLAYRSFPELWRVRTHL